MLDKIKQKLHSSNQSETDNKTISASTSSSSPSESQSRRSSENPNRLSVSGERQARSGSTAGAENDRDRSRSRNLDVFWKSSLYDSSNPQGHGPKDAHVKASSNSVAMPHPSMAEIGMEKMPYQDWSKE